MKIDNEKIEEWLGSCNPLEEAISSLKELYNEEYSLKMFQQDVKEYHNICSVCNTPFKSNKDEVWCSYNCATGG